MQSFVAMNRRKWLTLGLATGGVWVAGRTLWGATEDEKPEHPFLKNVKVTVTPTHLIVESDGIPNHKTAEYPNATNPNSIRKQNYRFKIPRQPQRAEKTTPLPMGPIGVAINGIPFYNPYNREGRDAVEGPFAEVFDSCCGHPDPLGRYHYHKYPVCVRSPFRSADGEHSPLIGYAFDGYPVYGPNDIDGKPPTNLDDCNGHVDTGEGGSARGYHYHVTTKFPYILGAYRGVVEQENIGRGPGGARPGGPGGPGGPPPKKRPPVSPP